jgi:hypothetical protein
MTTPEPRRPTWLENFTFMAVGLAAIAFFSNIQNVGKGISAHLGEGSAGWIAYVAAMAFGALLIIAAWVLSHARFKGPNPRPTGGALCVSFLIVAIVGVVGQAAADALEGDMRMKITEGHWWSVTLGSWPDLQGVLGWIVALFTFLGGWATMSQVADSWRWLKQNRISK